MKAKSEKSGRFVLRLDSALHETLARRALERGLSLNQMTADLIRSGLEEKRPEKKYLRVVRPLLGKLKREFEADFLGLMIFGSQVRGEATSTSDLDVLIVLEERVPLKRNLYRWWEESFGKSSAPEISPHFVHIPKTAGNASGIWFEVAMEGEIVYQRNRGLRRFLDRVTAEIQSGALQREWSHGHPYWIRRDNEKYNTGG